MNLELPEHLKLAKLPPRIELMLYLIKGELRHTKFTAEAENIGFDATFHSFDFAPLILALAGIEIRSDEVFEWYSSQVDTYLQKIDSNTDEEQLTELAFNFLMDVEFEKRKRFSEK